MYTAVAIALNFAFPLPASACEPFTVPWSYLDDPIEQNADGSFRVRNLRSAFRLDNGDEYWSDDISGARAIDIGSGRIGQKITLDAGCSLVEYLLFIDCGNGEAIKLTGIYYASYDKAGGPIFPSIMLIQKPRGAIALHPTTTVAEVEAIAKANDYEYTRDVMAYVRTMIRPQRYDPFIGCKIFYPDSAGAKM